MKTSPETPGLTWTRSSRCSADSPQCVEVAAHADRVLVRDSKNPDASNVQVYSRAEWAAFVAGVAAGDFDRI
jgi:hypothetical protein